MLGSSSSRSVSGLPPARMPRSAPAGSPSRSPVPPGRWSASCGFPGVPFRPRRTPGAARGRPRLAQAMAWVQAVHAQGETPPHDPCCRCVLLVGEPDTSAREAALPSRQRGGAGAPTPVWRVESELQGAGAGSAGPVPGARRHGRPGIRDRIDVVAGVDPVLVSLGGEFDLHAAPSLDGALRPLSARHVEIDCSGVTFMDSSGSSLNALVVDPRITLRTLSCS
ncbi:STAS domain-containing protein [Streptomyces sp. NPDC055092]